MDNLEPSRVELLVKSKSSSPNLNVIFVHGIYDDWHFNWASPNSASWIVDILPNDVPKAMVYVYGFDLLKKCAGSELLSLRDETRPLLEFVQRKNQLPCIFVAHSLGGILLREVLTHLEVNHARNIVKGIIFLSAPTYNDAELDDWEMFSVLLRDASMKSKIPNRAQLIQLGKVNRRFTSFAERIPAGRLLCVYETLPVYRVGLILPKNAAILEGAEYVESNADHFTICKFDSIFDLRYHFLVRSIRLVERGDVVVQSEIITEDSKPSQIAKVSADGREEVFQAPETLESAKKFARVALALEDQGQYNEAEMAYRQALQEYENIETDLNQGYQDQHSVSFHFFCLDKLASVLRDQSKFLEAKESAEKVWNLRKKTLGVADITTLASAGNLARILRYQGENTKAYGIVRDALIAIEESPFHSMAGTTAVSILAKILKELGIYEISELLSRDVIRACNHLLGPDHPFTLNRESDLAVVKSKQGEFAAAERIARHAFDGLSRSLGANHPNTLRTNKRLASYLRFQGKCSELMIELGKIRDRQIKLFGPSHPETMSTMCGIASVHALQGDFREAKDLLETVVDNRLNIFPEGHIDTEWARKGITKIEAAEAAWVAPQEVKQYLTNLTMRRHKRGKKRRFSTFVSEESRSSKINDLVTFFSSPTRPKDVKDSSKDVLFDTLHRNYDHSFADSILITNPKDWKQKYNSKVLGEALRVACVRGDENVVTELLKANVDPSAIGGYYGNALQAAAYAGSTPIVELLLITYKVDPNVWVGIFGSALRAASLQGNEAVVDVLIRFGAKPDVRDDFLGSALQAALIRKQLKMAELLLEKGADPDAIDISFGSPLQEASCSGNADLVKLLLHHRADPNLRRGVIGSPLLMAASENHPEIVEQLLQKHSGKEPETRLEGFEAALEVASYAGYMDVVQTLLGNVQLDTKEYGTALQAAAAGGHSNLVREILNQVASDGPGSSSESVNEE